MTRELTHVIGGTLTKGSPIGTSPVNNPLTQQQETSITDLLLVAEDCNDDSDDDLDDDNDDDTHLVSERLTDDGGVSVVANDHQVEDGDRAHRHVEGDVNLTQRHSQRPPLQYL